MPTRDDRQSRQRHDSPCGAAILDLPDHGRLRFHDAVRLRDVVLLLRHPRRRPETLADADGGMVHSVAVDRRRNRLVRRRIRPPTLDHLRRIADPHERIHLSSEQLWFSLAGFALFYTVLLIIEMYLMLKYVRLGPSSLHTGRYHFEQSAALAH